MKQTIVMLCLAVIALVGTAEAKEFKQKKGFKVPEGSAFVTTIDVNLDKVRDFIVQSPDAITIYNGKDHTKLYTIPLDAKSDESFFIDFVNNGRFTRSDLVKDLNGNGVLDMPIRGLDITGSEYIKIIDPKTQEKMLETRFSRQADNLFIYDVDGNDTLDVVIERLDSVLIFSSRVEVPSSVFSLPFPGQLASLEAYPNPSSSHSTIVWKRFGSTEGDPAIAVIVDATGREVRRIVAAMQENKAEFVWDGKSNDASAVPEGVYYVKVVSNEFANNTAIVVAR
ncbi:MAG: hypothetical protein JST20_03120 [Bacteroidetes bacterium]|nr:hypothetical protein [Bacteroidota bacterium]